MSTPLWLDDWLSPDRFRKYRNAAGGDVDVALALYEWNSEIAAAFLHDLGHLEVGLRNAYDRALLQHPGLEGRDWLDEAESRTVLFPLDDPPGKRGARRDRAAPLIGSIRAARRSSGYGTRSVPRGKAVAELMFGFWTYLTADTHEKTIWAPCLHRAYVAGADRARVHAALAALRAFRNRVAHHESVFDREPENQRRRIVYVARHLSPELQRHIVSSSRLHGILAARPGRGDVTRPG